MKIITVDDGDEEQKAFQKVFTDNEDEWVHYKEFVEAREAINSGLFDDADIIILDVQLVDTELAGVELAELIRQREIEAKLVVLSTSRVQETVCKCLKKGALSYIHKPVDSEDLPGMIEGILSVAPLTLTCDTAP